MNKFPKLKSRAILAPIAGFTDRAFRQLCNKYGTGISYTEFVSANAIIQENKTTQDLLKKYPKESPCGVQIFGSSPKIIAQATQILSESFDIIDLNCGCPVKKVEKAGAGVALISKPELLSKILQKMTDSTNKPITIKTRIGNNEKSINIFETLKIAQDCGIDAITIHGRTKAQGYFGKADWKIIKEVKERAEITVIGNGDIRTKEDFFNKITESGVDYAMIGRGALGNPTIFKAINSKKEINIEKEQIFWEYLKLAEKYKIAFQQIKNHSMFFSKGVVNGSKFHKLYKKVMLP